MSDINNRQLRKLFYGEIDVPLKYERKSVDLILSTAESLKKVTEQFTQVAADMQQHGMTDALFPWTQRQWDCLDVVITLANQCVSHLPSQITAKSQNRQSKYEITVKKSQRDLATRTARKHVPAAEAPKRARSKKPTA